jgi:hypothetical protein
LTGEGLRREKQCDLGGADGYGCSGCDFCWGFCSPCRTVVVARVRRRGDCPPTLMCVSGAYGETRNSCLLLVEKNGMESPPGIMVTRNPNWSKRSGTETGCVKGRY